MAALYGVWQSTVALREQTVAWWGYSGAKTSPFAAPARSRSENPVPFLLRSGLFGHKLAEKPHWSKSSTPWPKEPRQKIPENIIQKNILILLPLCATRSERPTRYQHSPLGL
jgi:hypothetical protein